MKIKKISLLMALVVSLGLIFTACAGEKPEEEGPKAQEAQGLEEILASGKLVMGTSADYPPYQFHAMIDGKDEIVGFEMEMAKYIAGELGLELEIKEMDFSNLLSSLSTGMVDIVVAGMNPLPSRLEEADFTDVYYEASFSALIRQEDQDKYKTEEDLKDQKVGVQMGTTQEEMAESLSSDILSLGKNPDLVMNLKTKKIDCVLMETPVAKSFAKVNPDLILAEDFELNDDSSGVAIALPKGSQDLQSKINEIVGDMEAKGLIEKWFIEAQEISDQAIED